MGKISRHILNKINKSILSNTKVNQRKTLQMPYAGLKHEQQEAVIIGKL